MTRRWSIAPTQPILVQSLARPLELSPLLAQCLINRGLSEPDAIRRFLEPRLRHLTDPFRLPDMDSAVRRLRHARDAREPLVVFGDYDVDGITSTALLAEVLTRLGWTVHTHLPDRFDDGYGLSASAVEACLARFPVRLILAVDCGSTAADTIDGLNKQGIETIVLDHHQLDGKCPAAVAVVNPQRHPDVASVGRELCSAGLAFKLAHALVKTGRECGEEAALGYDLRPLLDLVALGTVADLVPLTGENRILVAAGLERLNQTQRPGLQALCDTAQVKPPLGVYEVGFQLAPRLNAAGRMESAQEALALLMAPDRAAADPIARRLDAHNRERQNTERGIVKEITDAIRQSFAPDRDWVIVEGRDHWHIGVVGIVASRLVQEFYRPTLVLGGDGGSWRGSGRSIEGFDLAAALGQCGDMLTAHGGHAMAAGLSLQPDRLDALRLRLNDLAKRTVPQDGWQPQLRIDQEVPLAELDLNCLRQLDRLQHTGVGNPPVHLCARGLAHQRPLLRMGAQMQHVKMWVTDGEVTHQAVWWGAGDKSLPVGRFHLAFIPKINRFNGRSFVQLQVLDWKAEGEF